MYRRSALPIPGQVFRDRETAPAPAGGRPPDARLPDLHGRRGGRPAPCCRPPNAWWRLPTEEQLGEAARAGVAPLTPTLFRRHAAWHDELAGHPGRPAAAPGTGPARDTVRALQASDAAQLDRQADRLLAGVMLGLDLGQAPLDRRGACRCTGRVWWRTPRRNTPTWPLAGWTTRPPCPCCGSKPVASVIRLGGAETGSRYLHCSVCQSQWHMVRVKCTRCESTRSIFYQELEPGAPGAQAPTVAPPKRRGAHRVVRRLRPLPQDRVDGKGRLCGPGGRRPGLGHAGPAGQSESGKLRHGVNLHVAVRRAGRRSRRTRAEANAAGSP
jgi:hypothetical protein